MISKDQGTQKLLTAVRLGDHEFLLWVSGDYSAATDGLSLAISQLAMEEYLKARGIHEGDDLWTIATKVFEIMAVMTLICQKRSVRSSLILHHEEWAVDG